MLGGGSLVVREDGLKSGGELYESVEREGVTIVYPPTGYVMQLVEEAAERGRGRELGVRTCCVGGEAVSLKQVRRIQGVLGARVINGYGPTETVVTPLLWDADWDGEEEGYAP